MLDETGKVWCSPDGTTTCTFGDVEHYGDAKEALD